jgi:HSP20 family molecular chaperone IbpA
MENNNKFIIEEMLPGYKNEDIKVNIDKEKRTIEICAKMSKEHEDKKTEKKGDVTVYTYEHKAQSFYKSMPLPKDIDLEKLSTSYKNDTLTVEFEKKAIEKKD